jgi:transposase
MAIRMITGGCPDQLKLPFALWTREAVAKLLARKFGVKVSVWTVGRYLRNWGLTPQKPARKAFEQNPEAVRRWLEEEYPGLKAAAKRERAEIHWGDQMGMRSDHQVGRSYGLRGRTPVVPGAGQRFSCNMISTVTNRGQLSFMLFRESFTIPVFLKFLRRLLRHRKRRMYLIVDRHSVHKSGRVTQWVAQHHAQLRLILLPAFSPELNPDELLNQDVKSNAVGRVRPSNQKEMMDWARSYLRSTQAHPEIVINYFREEHVRYAAL